MMKWGIARNAPSAAVAIGSLIVSAFLASGAALAATGVISIDENGDGFSSFGGFHSITSFQAQDPGPGGLANVLGYNLPFTGFQGDVLLTDDGVVFDVIRFNGDGTVLFYSDNVPTADSIGDTAAPPGSFYTNVVTLPELGDEVNNGAIYTPTRGQPGFSVDFTTTFDFISDGTGAPIPEPSSLATILGAGTLMLAVGRRRRQAR